MFPGEGEGVDVSSTGKRTSALQGRQSIRSLTCASTAVRNVSTGHCD
jgi:hypothetical protein